MKNCLVLIGIIGIVFWGGFLVFAEGGVQIDPLLCPIAAEITDARLGKITALTKGKIGCILPEEYLTAGWKQGVAPAWDMTKMTAEEYVEALNKIGLEYNVTAEEYNRNGLIVYYDKVREVAKARGEVIKETKMTGDFVIK